MKKHYSHVIDLLFPIFITLLLSICAFTVISLAVHFYSNQTLLAQTTYEAETPLAYITEKVRSNDINGSVSIQDYQGVDALVLGFEEYSTYIYVYENELKEITLKNDVVAELEEGTDIIHVNDFSMNEKDGLFTFTLDDQSACVKARSAS